MLPKVSLRISGRNASALHHFVVAILHVAQVTHVTSAPLCWLNFQSATMLGNDFVVAVEAMGGTSGSSGDAG